MENIEVSSEILEWRKKVVDVLTRRVHPQNVWMTPNSFHSFAKKRGLNTSIGNSRLEKWDQTGIFHPLIRYTYPVTVHRKLSDAYGDWVQEPFEGEVTTNEDFVSVIDNGWRPEHIHKPEFSETQDHFLTIASTENFKPWSSYKSKSIYGYSTIGGVYYHPYQIFRLRAAIDASKIACSFPDFEASSKIRQWFNRDLDRNRRSLNTRELCDLKTLYLLATIEDLYLPQWRGSRYQILVKGTLDTDVKSTWHEWANSFDAKTILSLSELNIEEIKEIRNGLAWNGRCLDPNRHFYLLFRHIPYDERQRLEGKALLAWDYYEAAELIGWFLRDATGENQPSTDDLNVSSGEWKKAHYGVEASEIDFSSGNILQRLLQHYTINPTYKLLLIIEGESEEAFIRTWCEIHDVDLAAYGIRIHTLSGISELLTDRPKRVARQAKADHAAVMVVADNDRGVDVLEKEWKVEGLISRIFGIEDLDESSRPIGALIWPRNFEEDNFTLDQILEAWRRWIFEKKPDAVVDPLEMKSAVETAQLDLLKDKDVASNSREFWIEAMTKAHRDLRYLPGIKSDKEVVKKTAIARHLASIVQYEQIPIVRFILNCMDIAAKATVYGPAQPSGSFGYPTTETEWNQMYCSKKPNQQNSN